jgi:UDP-N-acetylmuramoyl-tripeptide--D-alanyl-D-alanine ligase
LFSWTRLSHLAEWCNASLESARGPTNGPKNAADIPVQALSTDTRSLKKGDVFLALKGENFDGHDFVEEAVKRGAGAVIAERKFPVAVPQLVVPDALRALAAIGAGLRSRFTGKVAAVTGSAGKSSTKDMVAALLGPDTVGSPASFNNLMGVSRTLCLVQDSTRYLMLEMGMNALGEIDELCRAFRPQVGAITNIGDAHIGKLGGKRGIYQAKKEMFDFLAHSPETAGVALNLDDELVVEAFQKSFAPGARAVRYSAAGRPADISIRRKEIDSRTGYLSLSLKVGETELDAHFAIFGLHHAQNLAAALSIAKLLGLSLEEMRGRFDRIRPAAHRGEILALSDERILIDESYNSNPTALTSSLTSLCDLDSSRRRVLVLGDMRELGEFSEKLHAEVGRSLAALAGKHRFPFLLVGVGEQVTHLMAEVRRTFPDGAYARAGDADEALRILPGLLRPKDVLFVKGSRGIKLDRVVAGLTSGAPH